ncbi:MAG: aminotransferase class V-fold PLP-dependent enzyme [Candidatus Obscuribacterales bacterium]|nr:aminotransferase class V-fold PLP-dependent enzyme [Candidatus Obscuribacterales bacterium]
MMQLDLNLEKVRSEWAPPRDGSAYLNTGSCGRKPKVVIESLKKALEQTNINPTYSVFLDQEPWTKARMAASRLFAVDPTSLLIAHSTTQGMQMIMQSFLLKEGDEVVTTNHEHGSTKAILRFLQETRGVKVKTHEIDPLAGSDIFCNGMLDLVGPKTRLVQVSEIDCASGWRPNLNKLVSELEHQSIPLLVDGAHAPGHGQVRPSKYPLWTGSGHKWLCGPNGTGFIYVAPHLVSQLQPLWLSDRVYLGEPTDLLRFEYQGTTDVSRLDGLAEACLLYESLGEEAVFARQRQLVKYLRQALDERFTGKRRATIRTPDIDAEATAMLTFTFDPEVVPVTDLRETLWREHKIWIQPDFYYGLPNHGLRVSCHTATTEGEIDRLMKALDAILSK